MWTALLIAVLYSAPATPTEAPEHSTKSEPVNAGTAPIPLPQIIRSAEEAHRTLRTKLASLEEVNVAEEIQTELPALAAKVEPLAGRSTPLSKQELTNLGPALLRADEILAPWESELESAVKHVYVVRQDLRRMDATWADTAAHAKEEGAPSPVLERIATVRANVLSASTDAQRRLDDLLATQDQVASVRIRIDDALVAVKKARQLEADQLFEFGSVPLWNLLSRPPHTERLRQQIVQELKLHATTLREFLVATRGPALLLLGLWALLGIALWRGRRRMIPEGVTDPEAASRARVLVHPFASPALVILALAALLLRPRPLVVSQILLLGMLAAALVAASGLIPPKARRSTYVLAIIVAVHLLSSLAPEHSLLRRVLLLAVSLSGAGVMAGTLNRREWETAIEGRRGRSLLRAALLLGAFLLLVAAVANLFGNLNLAQVLTTGTLASTAMLLVLSGLLAVLRGLLAIALRSPWVKRWPMLADHAELFRTRLVRYLRLGAALLWLLFTARLFRISTPIWETVSAVVGFRAKLGAIDLSLGDLLAFGVTLWVSVLLARMVSFALEEGLKNRGLARGVPAAISGTAFYAVVAAGTVLAFLASGMEVTRFAVVIGTLGVGIGFGLQNVVNNFVSGLILLYERPVQVGDVIQAGGVTGTVKRIGIRSSTVATGQGAEVIVPNGELISKELVNWTLSDRLRQMQIDVSVASDTSPERVHTLLIRVAMENPAVLKAPPPAALFTGFTNGLNFQLLAWTERPDWPEVASDLRAAIIRALGDAGIQFPRNDVRVVSVDGGVPELTRRNGEPGPPAGTPVSGQR